MQQDAMTTTTGALLSVSSKPLSGERITAVYRLRCQPTEAAALAQFLCLEHSVELPGEILPEGFLQQEIVGRIETVSHAKDGTSLCTLSYASELASGGFTTLLNLLMGNAAFLPSVQLVDVSLSASITRELKGPRFGIAGIRKLTGKATGPLGATALKPVGASTRELAAIASALARGGVDILKEDDGISTQVFAPFEERVQRCVASVAEANARTGGHTLYIPNITGPLEALVDRAMFAQENGASGVEIMPGMTSLDSIRMVATTPGFNLPVVAHCSWQGALCRPPNPTLSMELVFGLLPRLAGADLSITTSAGGRFNLLREDCTATAQALKKPMANVPAAMPMPGGGVTLETLEEVVHLFGSSSALLVSGALFREPDLTDACKRYMEAVRSDRLVNHPDIA